MGLRDLFTRSRATEVPAALVATATIEPRRERVAVREVVRKEVQRTFQLVAMGKFDPDLLDLLDHEAECYAACAEGDIVTATVLEVSPADADALCRAFGCDMKNAKTWRIAPTSAAAITDTQIIAGLGFLSLEDRQAVCSRFRRLAACGFNFVLRRH